MITSVCHVCGGLWQTSKFSCNRRAASSYSGKDSWNICLSAARKPLTSNLLKVPVTHGALTAAKLSNMGLWMWTIPDISLSSLLMFDHSWGTEMQCKVKSHVTDRIHTGLECWLWQPKAKGRVTWRAFEQGTDWWKMAERKAIKIKIKMVGRAFGHIRTQGLSSSCLSFFQSNQ